jgi:putative FmdB family regulatory protein
MPTYEYRCPKGHEFEHFFRTISSAESSLKCPECGEMAERRMSGGTGLLFKGSGFYITDYGKDGKKDQRKASEASTSEGSSGGESGSKSSGEKSSGEKSSQTSSGEKSSEKSPGDKSSSKGSGSSDS